MKNLRNLLSGMALAGLLCFPASAQQADTPDATGRARLWENLEKETAPAAILHWAEKNYWAAANRDQRHELLEKMAARAGDSASRLAALALVRRLDGNADGAKEALARAEMAGRENLALLLVQARIKEEDGELEAAESLLRLAASTDTTTFSAQQLGEILQVWGAWDEISGLASGLFEKGRLSREETAEAIEWLAWRGMDKEAGALTEKAQARWPGFARLNRMPKTDGGEEALTFLLPTKPSPHWEPTSKAAQTLRPEAKLAYLNGWVSWHSLAYLEPAQWPVASPLDPATYPTQASPTLLQDLAERRRPEADASGEEWARFGAIWEALGQPKEAQKAYAQSLASRKNDAVQMRLILMDREAAPEVIAKMLGNLNFPTHQETLIRLFQGSTAPSPDWCTAVLGLNMPLLPSTEAWIRESWKRLDAQLGAAGIPPGGAHERLYRAILARPSLAGLALPAYFSRIEHQRGSLPAGLWPALTQFLLDGGEDGKWAGEGLPEQGTDRLRSPGEMAALLAMRQGFEKQLVEELLPSLKAKGRLRWHEQISSFLQLYGATPAQFQELTLTRLQARNAWPDKLNWFWTALDISRFRASESDLSPLLIALYREPENAALTVQPAVTWLTALYQRGRMAAAEKLILDLARQALEKDALPGNRARVEQLLTALLADPFWRGTMATSLARPEAAFLRDGFALNIPTVEEGWENQEAALAFLAAAPFWENLENFGPLPFDSWGQFSPQGATLFEVSVNEAKEHWNFEGPEATKRLQNVIETKGATFGSQFFLASCRGDAQEAILLVERELAAIRTLSAGRQRDLALAVFPFCREKLMAGPVRDWLAASLAESWVAELAILRASPPTPEVGRALTLRLVDRYYSLDQWDILPSAVANSLQVMPLDDENEEPPVTRLGWEVAAEQGYSSALRLLIKLASDPNQSRILGLETAIWRLGQDWWNNRLGVHREPLEKLLPTLEADLARFQARFGKEPDHSLSVVFFSALSFEKAAIRQAVSKWALEKAETAGQGGSATIYRDLHLGLSARTPGPKVVVPGISELWQNPAASAHARAILATNIMTWEGAGMADCTQAVSLLADVLEQGHTFGEFSSDELIKQFAAVSEPDDAWKVQARRLQKAWATQPHVKGEYYSGIGNSMLQIDIFLNDAEMIQHHFARKDARYQVEKMLIAALKAGHLNAAEALVQHGWPHITHDWHNNYDAELHAAIEKLLIRFEKNPALACLAAATLYQISGDPVRPDPKSPSFPARADRFAKVASQFESLKITDPAMEARLTELLMKEPSALPFVLRRRDGQPGSMTSESFFANLAVVPPDATKLQAAQAHVAALIAKRDVEALTALGLEGCRRQLPTDDTQFWWQLEEMASRHKISIRTWPQTVGAALAGRWAEGERDGLVEEVNEVIGKFEKATADEYDRRDIRQNVWSCFQDANEDVLLLLAMRAPENLHNSMRWHRRCLGGASAGRRWQTLAQIQADLAFYEKEAAAWQPRWLIRCFLADALNATTPALRKESLAWAGQEKASWIAGEVIQAAELTDTPRDAEVIPVLRNASLPVPVRLYAMADAFKRFKPLSPELAFACVETSAEGMAAGKITFASQEFETFFQTQRLFREHPELPGWKPAATRLLEAWKTYREPYARILIQPGSRDYVSGGPNYTYLPDAILEICLKMEDTGFLEDNLRFLRPKNARPHTLFAFALRGGLHDEALSILETESAGFKFEWGPAEIPTESFDAFLEPIIPQDLRLAAKVWARAYRLGVPKPRTPDEWRPELAAEFKNVEFHDASLRLSILAAFCETPAGAKALLAHQIDLTPAKDIDKTFGRATDYGQVAPTDLAEWTVYLRFLGVSNQYEKGGKILGHPGLTAKRQTEIFRAFVEGSRKGVPELTPEEARRLLEAGATLSPIWAGYEARAGAGFNTAMDPTATFLSALTSLSAIVQATEAGGRVTVSQNRPSSPVSWDIWPLAGRLHAGQPVEKRLALYRGLRQFFIDSSRVNTGTVYLKDSVQGKLLTPEEAGDLAAGWLADKSEDPVLLHRELAYISIDLRKWEDAIREMDLAVGLIDPADPKQASLRENLIRSRTSYQKMLEKEKATPP